MSRLTKFQNARVVAVLLIGANMFLMIFKKDLTADFFAPELMIVLIFVIFLLNLLAYYELKSGMDDELLSLISQRLEGPKFYGVIKSMEQYKAAKDYAANLAMTNPPPESNEAKVLRLIKIFIDDYEQRTSTAK